jgi:hypothetical protein
MPGKGCVLAAVHVLHLYTCGCFEDTESSTEAIDVHAFPNLELRAFLSTAVAHDSALASCLPRAQVYIRILNERP